MEESQVECLGRPLDILRDKDGFRNDPFLARWEYLAKERDVTCMAIDQSGTYIALGDAQGQVSTLDVVYLVRLCFHINS